MSNIRSIDIILLDEIFDMGSGYVLNFSDRAFAQFFAEERNIDIDNPIYARHGTSKAKRLRCFLRTVDNPIVIRTLKSLWEYPQALLQHSKQADEVDNAYGRLLTLVNRLEGRSADSVCPQAPVPAFDRSKLAQLKAALLSLSSVSAQARGYAFEKFLKQLFDAYGLAAQEPFRLQGEQIDGSFQFANDTYLVEAKWQSQRTGVADLHNFHGKIEQKAAWTRGLFVSNSGFTEDGLIAFGRASVSSVWTATISMRR